MMLTVNGQLTAVLDIALTKLRIPGNPSGISFRLSEAK